MKAMRFAKIAFLFMSILFILSIQTAIAGTHDTIYVDAKKADDTGDGSSWTTAKKHIQAAINIAAAQDQIYVKGYSDGTVYSEHITLHDWVPIFGGFTGNGDLRDTSSNPTCITVIDGGNATDCVVYAPIGITSSTILDHLTLQNGIGKLQGSYRYGGGLCCIGASPTIQHCRIHGNTAYSGSGIFADTSSSPAILDNDIYANQSTGSFCYGGGVLFYSGVFQNNRVNNNATNTLVLGGGVCVGSYGGSNATVTGNTINSNTTAYQGGGIALANTSSALNFSGNTIDNNTAADGGGLYVSGSTNIIANNITNNTATKSGSSPSGGGGIMNFGTGAIARNTISGNSCLNSTDSTLTNGGGICWSASSSSPGAIYCNLLTNNQACSGSGVYASGLTSSSIFANNTIVSNITVPLGRKGIYLNNPTGTYLKNNIISTYTQCGIYSTASYYSNRNCLYGNSTNYGGTSPTSLNDITATTNPGISNSVVFGNDYHLISGAPCINAGDNSVVGGSWTDIDGEPRRVPSNGTVDIGADEYCPTTSVPGAKLLPDSRPVELSGLVVTAAYSDFFYVESDDRSSGVRVNKTAHGISAGSRANVIGQTKTDANGERYIEASSVTSSGTGTVEPLAMNNRSIGGGVFGYQQGIYGAYGWNNVGLLIRTAGKVIETGDGWCKIDDGSSVSLKVLLPSGSTVATNDKIMVTGISSCEKDTSGNTQRLLRTRDASDIQAVSTGSTVSYSIYTGYNRVCAPIVPFDHDPLSVFPVGPYDMSRYDAASQGYISYDPDEVPPGASFGNVLWGEAYDLHATSNGSVSFIGYPEGLPTAGRQADVVIPLPGNQRDGQDAGGWNPLGDPFNHDIPTDSGDLVGDGIYLTDGISVKTWGEAFVDNWCDLTMVYTDPSTGTKTMGFDGTWDDNTLRAGKGYYFCTYKDNLALIIPADRMTPVVTAPIGTISDLAPVVTWTTSIATNRYQAQILTADGSTVVWDSGEVNSSSLSAQVTKLLDNNTSYLAQVKVGNSACWSMWSQRAQFTVVFTEPPLTSVVQYCVN